MVTSSCNRQKSNDYLSGERLSFDFDYQIILNDTILEKNDFKMTPFKLVLFKDSLGCPICLNRILSSVSNYLDRCNTFGVFDADSISFYVVMPGIPEEMQKSYMKVDIPFVYLMRNINGTITDSNEKIKDIEGECILLLNNKNDVVRAGDLVHNSKERKEFENVIISLLNNN